MLWKGRNELSSSSASKSWGGSGDQLWSSLSIAPSSEALTVPKAIHSLVPPVPSQVFFLTPPPRMLSCCAPSSPPLLANSNVAKCWSNWWSCALGGFPKPVLCGARSVALGLQVALATVPLPLDRACQQMVEFVAV